MKTGMRLDSVFTIAGLAALAVAYMLFLYLPGRKRIAELNQNISARQQTIKEIPLRVERLKALKADIRRRQEFLARNRPLVPTEVDLHQILDQIARLARAAQLDVTRLEPLDPIPHASYRTLPFHISLSGDFHGAVQFLTGMEGQDRLLTVDELSLTTDESRDTGRVQVDLHFSTYVRNDDSDYFDARSARRTADTGRR